jgi:hypothetical protein
VKKCETDAKSKCEIAATEKKLAAFVLHDTALL